MKLSRRLARMMQIKIVIEREGERVSPFDGSHVYPLVRFAKSLS